MDTEQPPILRATDDVLVKVFSCLASYLDARVIDKAPQQACQSFHWCHTTLPAVCRRFRSLLSQPNCCLWRTVLVSLPPTGAPSNSSLSKRSVSLTREEGPGTRFEATPQHAPATPASPPTWTAWQQAHHVRSSLEALQGCSPRSGTAAVLRTALNVPLLRAERVIEWVAAHARHCQVLYLDISKNHDFTARSVHQLLNLLRGSLRVLYLTDSPGQGRAGQEGYEVLSTLKQLQHLHIQGIPQDFLHLTMPYLSMLSSLQTLHFKPDLASYPSPARLTTLPASLQRLELVKVWIEQLPPPYDRLPSSRGTAARPLPAAPRRGDAAGARSQSAPAHQPPADAAAAAAAGNGLAAAAAAVLTGRGTPPSPTSMHLHGNQQNGLSHSQHGYHHSHSQPARPHNSPSHGAGVQTAGAHAGGVQPIQLAAPFPLRIVRLTECQVTPSALLCLVASPSLEELHLFKCTPACTPSAVAAWTPMAERDASFGALPLPGRVGLKALTLAACRLTCLLPVMVEALSGLESLDLSHNEELGLDTHALPPEFAQLVHLTRLELRGCGLVTLPASVAALPSLKSLNLEGNVLTGLPKQLACEGRLELANISCNRLACLPPCLYSMSNLRQLVVSSGPVAGTPDFHTLHLQLPRLALLQVKGTSYDCRAVRNLLQLGSCVQRAGAHLHIDVEVPPS